MKEFTCAPNLVNKGLDILLSPIEPSFCCPYKLNMGQVLKGMDCQRNLVFTVYTNGNSLDGHHLSGPGSLGESSSAPESMSPPPDLPELPDLPPLPPVAMAAGPDASMAGYAQPMAYGAPPAGYPMHHHPYGAGIAPYPPDARPAPLGRRSPPAPAGARRSAYRGRSPSPSENDSRYAMSDSDARSVLFTI